MRIAGPRTAGYTAHHVPQHGRAQNLVYPLAAVAHHAETTVDGFADAYAAAVVQGYEAHAAGTVAGKALYGHVGHDVTAVLDVGRLTEGRVGAADVVVVAPQHDGTYLATAHHLVEPQCYLHASLCILVEDTGLGAHYEVVLLGIANPVVVVPILSAAGGVDALHGGTVGLDQVLVLAAQTYPTEGTVTVIEQFGAHDVLHVTGEDKAVLVVSAAGYLGDACVENGLHERVAVVEEIRAAVHQRSDNLEVSLQRGVHQAAECGRIFMK